MACLIFGVSQCLESSSTSFRFSVLSNISYLFHENKITAILGKSGSGKTTLLQILNGMIKPDTGTVTISNQSLDYKALHAVRTKMGFVIQQAGLFPHLSVKENISILGKVNKQQHEAMSTRVNQLIDLVQLPLSYLEKYPHELSGGEQQRVAVARALINNPDVILADEPSGNLDSHNKKELHELFFSLRNKYNQTFVIVTHDTELAGMSDRTITMHDGLLVS